MIWCACVCERQREWEQKESEKVGKNDKVSERKKINIYRQKEIDI